MYGQMFHTRKGKKKIYLPECKKHRWGTNCTVSLSQVSSVSVWSIKQLTINYCPAGEAADEKEQVISCWAAVLH